MTGTLIPEYRTDKNGRNVLRYVRPEAPVAANAGLSGIAPSVASQAVPVEFNAGLQSFWNRHEIGGSGYTCADLDPKAVDILNRVFSPDSEHEPSAIMTALRMSFSEMLGAGEEDEGRISTHNIAAFAADLHEVSRLRGMIEGLHRTVGYRKDYLLDADEEERAKAAALIKFIYFVGENVENWDAYTEMEREKYEHYISLTDDSLKELAMDYHDRIDDLIALIGETDTLPPVEHLRAMMEHEQPALAKGVL